MRHLSILAAAALVVSGGVFAQAQAPDPARRQSQQTESGTQPGFFRPAPDIALTTVPQPRQEPAAAPATPDMADEVRRAETASLERLEAAMDRVETAHERAMAKPAPLPPITSPLEGNAPIVSPLDGTAPIITPTNR